MNHDPQSLLSSIGLRDTQPRRLVLSALINMKKPLTQKEIFDWITQKKAAVNLVTVYRTLEVFKEKGIVHDHPSSGAYVLCSLPQQRGHHILLSCHSCGQVEECSDAELCAHENRIAKNVGFSPTKHISELIGICSHCS